MPKKYEIEAIAYIPVYMTVQVMADNEAQAREQGMAQILASHSEQWYDQKGRRLPPHRDDLSAPTIRTVIQLP